MPYIGRAPTSTATKLEDADQDTKIQVEESSDEDTIRFDIAGAEDFTMTANALNVLSGSTLNINSGATIANSGTATGFGFASGDVILADDGAVGLPGLAFADDTDNGLYRIGTNNIALATAGTKRIDINATGQVGINGAPQSGYEGLTVIGTGDSGSTNYFLNIANGAHNIVAANTHSAGGGGAAIYATVAGNAANPLNAYATHATYGSSWQACAYLVAERAASSDYHFLLAVQGSDKEFDLKGDGNGYCDGSWSGSGADYAEYFEWKDGNSDSEDRVGISVVLDENMIRAATEDDAAATIIGVVSGNPVVVGDTAWGKWHSKHLRDDFGRYLQEEHPTYSWTDDDGEFHSHAQDDLPEGLTPPADVEAVMIDRRVLNPDWVRPTEFEENGDPVETYVSRKDRPEWDTVGLMGKLKIKKGQPVGDRWIRMRDVSDSVEEWLVR